MLDDRAYCIVDNLLCPERRSTETGYAEDKSTHSQALVPSSIGELEEVGVGYLLEQNLAHYAQMYTAVTTIEVQATMVQTRWKVSAFWNEPTKMVISATKPEKPGRPRLAKPATT